VEATLISYALLSAEINTALIEQSIKEAIKNNLYSVISASFWCKKIARELKDTSTYNTCIVGHPYGQQLTEVKLFEAKKAIEMGAKEIILTLNTSAIKSGTFEWVKIEIARFAKFLHEQEKLLGLYIATNYFSALENEKLISTAQSAGADYLLVPFDTIGLERLRKSANLLGVKVLCGQEVRNLMADYPFIEEIVIKK